MRILFILLIALISCNKNTGPIMKLPMGITPDFTLSVSQAKGTTYINATIHHDQPYNRIMTVYCKYSGSRDVVSRLQILPGDTLVTQIYQHPGILVDYWSENYHREFY